MNKEPKKRISISIPLDMIEKIERINQDEYYGQGKVQHIMLALIGLSFLAINYFDGFKTAWAVLEQEIEEPEPVIVPSHGNILEFPLGKRLPAG